MRAQRRVELGQRSRRPTVAAVRLTPVLLAQLNQGTATGDRAHSLEIRVFRDSEASAKAAGQAFKAGILSVATQLPAPPPAASAVRFFCTAFNKQFQLYYTCQGSSVLPLWKNSWETT